MPAQSKKQQQLFGLARAVQKGEIPAHKVTSNVRQIAQDASSADVDDMASTKTANLPDRVRPKHTATESYPMTFGEVVKQYESLRETISNVNKFKDIATQLSAIAEFAESTITNEMADDWYDGHTVQRNIKEMKKYVMEFNKIATEADGHNQRMAAYYEDMGRILERYFQVYDEHAADTNVDYQDANATTRPPLEEYDVRAVNEIKRQLSKSKLKEFNQLPRKIQAEVAWRLL